MKLINALLFSSLTMLSLTVNAQQSIPLKQDFFTTKNFKYRKFADAEKEFDDSLRLLPQRAVDITLLFPSTSSKLVTSVRHNQLIGNVYTGISGSEVKNGKQWASSGVIDEKGITINLSCKPYKNRYFYITPVIRAESDEGFISLFEKSNYSNTISVGSNFTILPRTSISNYGDDTKKSLHRKIKMAWMSYIESKSATETYFKNRLNEIRKAQLDGTSILYSDSVYFSRDIKRANLYQNALDTLVGIGILPPYFASLDLEDQKRLMSRFDNSDRIEKVVFKKLLDKLDDLQMKDSFTLHRLNWWTFGAKFNSEGHKILDLNAKKLTTLKRQSYFSGNLSHTWLWYYAKGDRLYISPTITYSNEHAYSEDLLLKTQVLGASYPLGNVGSAAPILHDLEYYPSKIILRVRNLNLDFPLAWYSSKRKFGMEIGFKISPNDPDANKFSARLGAFVPLNPGSESQVMIQPIVKFQKLNSVGNFWEDNVVVGVNLSISLPKGLFK